MNTMKKFLTNIAVVSAMVIGLSACSLDAIVYSDMTSGNYPKVESDAQSLLDGMYGYLKTNSGSVSMSTTANTGWGWPVWSIGTIGWYGWQMFTTDEARYGGASNQYTDFTWGTTGSWLETFQIIKNVSRMTYIIDVIENCEGISDSKKARMIAEAKTLRGIFMYVIYDLFGPFHVTLDPAELDDIKYVARPSDAEYRTNMIKDFEDAIPNLVDKTNNTADWGRLNKGFVRMLLAKIYMRKHEYAKALPYLEAIVNSNQYTLAEDYFVPFSEEEDDENIYCIPSGPKADNEFYFYMTPGNCGAFLGVNKAHSHDGQGTFNTQNYWGGAKVQWAFYDTFKDYDVRKGGMAEAFRDATDPTKIYTRENPGSSNLQYGAMCCKYFYSKERAYEGNIHSVCFRYADCLLMIAECDAMINGVPTDRSMKYLKMITDRAGNTSDIPADAATNLESFKTFLLAERGRELYFEGWRRDDLLRFDQYISNAVARGKRAEEKHKLMPIPISVINESGGIITQNPGY